MPGSYSVDVRTQLRTALEKIGIPLQHEIMSEPGLNGLIESARTRLNHAASLVAAPSPVAVSYTHLTLPTICSV